MGRKHEETIQRHKPINIFESFITFMGARQVRESPLENDGDDQRHTRAVA